MLLLQMQVVLGLHLVILQHLWHGQQEKVTFTDFLFLFPAAFGGFVVTAFLLSRFVPNVKPDLIKKKLNQKWQKVQKL